MNMGYRYLLYFSLLLLFAWSCKSTPAKREKMKSDSVNTQGASDDTLITGRKYGIKSGEIIYENTLNTISVHMSYKTIVYFDNYGMKECRDTYSGDTLTDSYMSDGKNTYRISHIKREAFFSGKAYKGTEPKFGWNEVGEADKESGKVKLAPDEIIAGKDCKVYTVTSGIVTAKYAGWNDILLLSEIKSPGGISLTQAVRVTVGDVPQNKFLIPKGYKVK